MPLSEPDPGEKRLISEAAESPLILAIESSCDETAVAILEGSGNLRCSLVASQAQIHAEFGGVVPEVASRSHLEALPRLVSRAFEETGFAPAQIAAFAATSGPGLGPALLVGLSYAKGLAVATNRPFLAVNHLEGHLLSPFFGRDFIPHHVGLLVSGGHTLLVEIRGAGNYSILGRTRDDAAGEAFDKAAKLLGLPYPGGALLDRLAQDGDPGAVRFPQGLVHDESLDFSFSGLKTSLRYLLEKEPPPTGQRMKDLCASFREAVVQVLVRKTLRAARQAGANCIALSGGVACNSRLRTVLAREAASAGMDLFCVAPELATDNAAMIAFAAHHRFAVGAVDRLDEDIQPSFAGTFQRTGNNATTAAK